MAERGSHLYLTPAADRFFLAPAGEELLAGDVVVLSITGEERRLDAASLAFVEVTRVEALMYLRAQAEREVATVADMIGHALRLSGMGSEKRQDLRRIAERLGVSQAELRHDPEAAKAAFQRFADDVYAVSAAVASGDAADLEAARERMAAWGIDLGDTLGDLSGYFRAVRYLDQEGAAHAAARGLRALADTIEGDQASLGRRIDELITRMDRDFGPLVGEDPEREQRRRQEEYRRSAKSAIADALRAAGITPLASAEAENRDGPDREN